VHLLRVVTGPCHESQAVAEGATRDCTRCGPTAVARQWTDETLEVTDELYGREWPRGLTLAVVLYHEIHHRGQMTVLMRQAGLKVPGVYGPSADEE